MSPRENPEAAEVETQESTGTEAEELQANIDAIENSPDVQASGLSVSSLVNGLKAKHISCRLSKAKATPPKTERNPNPEKVERENVPIFTALTSQGVKILSSLDTQISLFNLGAKTFWRSFIAENLIAEAKTAFMVFREMMDELTETGTPAGQANAAIMTAPIFHSAVHRDIAKLEKDAPEDGYSDSSVEAKRYAKLVEWRESLVTDEDETSKDDFLAGFDELE